MENNQDHLDEFDQYWVLNLDKNRNKCRMLGCHVDDIEDVLNDAFVKIRQIISRGGEIKSFKDYSFLTIRNMTVNKHKDKQKRMGVDYPVDLEQLDDNTKQNKQIFVMEIFDWVVDYYGEHDGWLFRFKYETGFGCRRLAGVTGLEYSKIWKIIKKIEGGVITHFGEKYLEQCKRY